MPSLRELQQALCAAILEAAPADAEAHVVSDDLAAAKRLNIYRNTFTATLTGALRLSYPAVERLVGAEFFEGAGRAFIERHPPRSAYLNLFGGEFVEFLAQFPPAAPLAYLADVARLEWAVNCALHAKDAPPIDLARIRGLTDSAQARLRFIAHPSVRFLRADFPADAIWRAVLEEDDEALAGIDLASGPAWLIVHRLAGDVKVARLEEPEWRFVERLCAGEDLAHVLPAVDEASARLAVHLARGLFTDFSISGEKETAEGEPA